MSDSAHRKIELDQQPTFQRIEWFAQRVGWLILGAIIVAGVLGFLGDGPFSSTTASSSDGRLAVSYDQYLHRHAPSRIDIDVTSLPGASELILFLSDEFLAAVEIHQITPEATEEFGAEGFTGFRFRLQPEATRTSISIHFEPQESGPLQCAVRTDLSGAGAAEARQFVYP
jgi:hypothetical protein